MENLALMQLKEAVKTGDMHKACEYINLVTNLNIKNKKVSLAIPSFFKLVVDK
jgi:hypothetical protein